MRRSGRNAFGLSKEMWGMFMMRWLREEKSHYIVYILMRKNGRSK